MGRVLSKRVRRCAVPRLAQIAASIKDNKSLKLLDVGGNNISEDGAKALAGDLTPRLRFVPLHLAPLACGGAGRRCVLGCSSAGSRGGAGQG